MVAPPVSQPCCCCRWPGCAGAAKAKQQGMTEVIPCFIFISSHQAYSPMYSTTSRPKPPRAWYFFGELNRRILPTPSALRIWGTDADPARGALPLGPFRCQPLVRRLEPLDPGQQLGAVGFRPQDHQHPAFVSDAGHGLGSGQLRALWRSVNSRSLSTSCRWTRTRVGCSA